MTSIFAEEIAASKRKLASAINNWWNEPSKSVWNKLLEALYVAVECHAKIFCARRPGINDICNESINNCWEDYAHNAFLRFVTKFESGKDKLLSSEQEDAGEDEEAFCDGFPKQEKTGPKKLCQQNLAQMKLNFAASTVASHLMNDWALSFFKELAQVHMNRYRKALSNNAGEVVRGLAGKEQLYVVKTVSGSILTRSRAKVDNEVADVESFIKKDDRAEFNRILKTESLKQAVTWLIQALMSRLPEGKALLQRDVTELAFEFSGRPDSRSVSNTVTTEDGDEVLITDMVEQADDYYSRQFEDVEINDEPELAIKAAKKVLDTIWSYRLKVQQLHALIIQYCYSHSDFMVSIGAPDEIFARLSQVESRTHSTSKKTRQKMEDGPETSCGTICSAIIGEILNIERNNAFSKVESLDRFVRSKLKAECSGEMENLFPYMFRAFMALAVERLNQEDPYWYFFGCNESREVSADI